MLNTNSINSLNINSIVKVDNNNNSNNEDEEDDDDLYKNLIGRQVSLNNDLVNSQTNLIAKQKKYNESTFRSYGLKLSRSKSFNVCLYLTDVFLSVVVFSPIIGLFWYSTWSFLDEYFLSDNKYLSNFVCLGLGLLIIFPGYMFQGQLETCYDKLKEFRYARFWRFLMRNIYIYLISLAVIFQWRAIWNIYTFYLFKDAISQLCLAIVAIAYFCLTRSTRTLVCNPYLLYRDESEEFFVSESRHKIHSFNSKYCQYFFDFFMVEIVECLIMNFIWFGLQSYFDNVIYPDDPVYCIVTTFAISHIICLVILFSQNLVFGQCVQCCLVPRLVVEDLFNIIMVVSVTLAWKFYWNVIDYLFYDKSKAFYLFLGGHIGSYLIALACNITGSLVGPGTGLQDGENKETKAYFEVSFLSNIFKNYLGINDEEEEKNIDDDDVDDEKEQEEQTMQEEEQRALIVQSESNNSIN